MKGPAKYDQIRFLEKRLRAQTPKHLMQRNPLFCDVSTFFLCHFSALEKNAARILTPRFRCPLFTICLGHPGKTHTHKHLFLLGYSSKSRIFAESVFCCFEALVFSCSFSRRCRCSYCNTKNQATKMKREPNEKETSKEMKPKQPEEQLRKQTTTIFFTKSQQEKSKQPK